MEGFYKTRCGLCMYIVLYCNLLHNNEFADEIMVMNKIMRFIINNE